MVSCVLSMCMCCVCCTGCVQHQRQVNYGTCRGELVTHSVVCATQVCCGVWGCCATKRCINNATTNFQPRCCGDDCNIGRAINCCNANEICVNQTGVQVRYWQSTRFAPGWLHVCSNSLWQACKVAEYRRGNFCCAFIR